MHLLFQCITMSIKHQGVHNALAPLQMYFNNMVLELHGDCIFQKQVFAAVSHYSFA